MGRMITAGLNKRPVIRTASLMLTHRAPNRARRARTSCQLRGQCFPSKLPGVIFGNNKRRGRFEQDIGVYNQRHGQVRP